MALTERPVIPGLRMRVMQYLTSRMTDPAVLAKLSRLPVARWFARRDAERLFDMVSGFVYSQTLFACVEIGLFEILKERPASLSAIARAGNLSAPAADRLCRAAAALDLIVPHEDGYRLGRLGAACLGVPGLQDMIRHHVGFYQDMADPLSLLRDQVDAPHMAAYWSYVHSGDGVSAKEAETYSRLMSSSQGFVARETLRMVDLSRFASILDIGGGQGVFLKAVLENFPHLRAGLFDLPQVLDGFSHPVITAEPGNFKTGAVPSGYDVVSLIRVLFDHSDETVTALLDNVFHAIEPGGLVIVSEPMKGQPKPEKPGDAYYAFYTLAMKTGRTRRPDDIVALLMRAGFSKPVVHKNSAPETTRVITCQKL